MRIEEQKKKRRKKEEDVVISIKRSWTHKWTIYVIICLFRLFIRQFTRIFYINLRNQRILLFSYVIILSFFGLQRIVSVLRETWAR